MRPSTCRRLGITLVVLGLLTIVVSVLVVCDLADGSPTSFAHRRSYNQVKVELQRSFPIALLVSLGGLGLAMVGARLARRDESTPQDNAQPDGGGP